MLGYSRFGGHIPGCHEHSGVHARCKRPNARHSLPFSSYFSTVESDGVARQEAQIVRSWLTLDDFLPPITRP